MIDENIIYIDISLFVDWLKIAIFVTKKMKFEYLLLIYQSDK
jgi:hypothetical protein